MSLAEMVSHCSGSEEELCPAEVKVEELAQNTACGSKALHS